MEKIRVDFDLEVASSFAFAIKTDSKSIEILDLDFVFLKSMQSVNIQQFIQHSSTHKNILELTILCHPTDKVLKYIEYTVMPSKKEIKYKFSVCQLKRPPQYKS